MRPASNMILYTSKRKAAPAALDYNQIAVNLDAGILKDLMDQIIHEIYVQDDRVVQIRFASGLEHEF